MIPLIVIDTNILVSALLGAAGASREILRWCLRKDIQPLMGNALFLEYESLLSRDDLFVGCLLSYEERETLFDAFLSVCLWVDIYYGWRPNLRDEADNHLIELAVAGGATRLVTKNLRDFRNTELLFPGVKAISPEAFLQEVQRWRH
jgi:putative PIN family toxin of toxin-antitoxin system